MGRSAGPCGTVLIQADPKCRMCQWPRSRDACCSAHSRKHDFRRHLFFDLSARSRAPKFHQARRSRSLGFGPSPASPGPRSSLVLNGRRKSSSDPGLRAVGAVVLSTGPGTACPRRLLVLRGGKRRTLTPDSTGPAPPQTRWWRGSNVSAIACTSRDKSMWPLASTHWLLDEQHRLTDHGHPCLSGFAALPCRTRRGMLTA